MKTSFTFLLLHSLVLFSFIDPYSKKKITDKEYKYEFYTTTKKVAPKDQTTYYWFKGGAIHSASEGIGGELLHGPFLKFYLSNQLAEQGNFRNGKKVGLWKTWYPSGMICSQTSWSSGNKNGRFIYYSEQGMLLESGRYRNNMKQGRWINAQSHDTLKYKNDNVVLKKTKSKKKKKENKPLDNATQSTPRGTTTSKAVKPQKKSLFKRLFAKKNTVTNGKSH